MANVVAPGSLLSLNSKRLQWSYLPAIGLIYVSNELAEASCPPGITDFSPIDVE